MVRTAWKWAIVAGVAMVAGYFALPGLAAKNVGYSVIGAVAVTVVVVGTRIHRPEDRLGWLYLAGGNLLFVVGDAAYPFYQFVLHRSVPLPSVADALYLAGYPLVLAGAVRLTGGRDGSASRESYADAAIISIGALAVTWHFLMGSYAHDGTISLLGRLVSIAYPMMDIGVLFIVLRGLFHGGFRQTAYSLLGGSLACLLVSDLVYDLINLHGSYTTGDPVDAGWLVSYLLLAVAALHPSMAATRPARVDVDTGSRLPAVAAAGLVAPGILLISQAAGVQVDVATQASLTIVLFVLVFARMRWLSQRAARQASDLKYHAGSLEEALAARAALEADLRHQAFHDSLTGLANRALFHDRVEHAVAGATRTGDLVAVLVCDLDGFKTVNDSLGHAAGDRLLHAVSRRLTTIVRPGDTVARLGGDEFAVLLEKLAHPDVAGGIAERMVSVLHQPVQLDGREVVVSASVGVVIADTGSSTEQLLADADSAMYEAKSAGKDCYRLFEASMHARLVERMELTTSFHSALRQGQFLLEYQPHFSLASGQLEGFEALVRWDHPSIGRIPPGRFIPLAEETGFIVPLGRWVLEEACTQATRWPVADGQELTMSVNLSARQLRHRNLVSDVRTALAFSGLAPRQLILEITESTLMTDSDETVRILTDLRALGVHLAIDDFGTGYSSLSYLRRFPVEMLKIDKMFVDPLVDSTGEGAALVKTIIRLARSLGLRTIAEGIEHPRQQEQLAQLGCDSAQGFLMGRPLDRRRAEALVGGGLSAPLQTG